MCLLYKYKLKNIINSFFLLYLIIGLIIVNDFGISIDEAIERKTGIISFEFVNSFFGAILPIDKIYDVNLMHYDHRNYGSILQIICYILERWLHLNEPRQYFLLRHIVVFIIFWYSTYIFYRLVSSIHNNKLFGIIGALSLILTPRIFGDSFFNPKDIPFLSTCIFYAFSLYKLNVKASHVNVILTAFFSALAISIRVVGAYLIFITIGLLLFNKYGVEHWTNNRLLTLFKKVFFYTLLVGALTVIFWPSIWMNTIDNLIYSIKSMAHFNWNNQMLFLGNYINGKNVPLYYSFVWMFATTPLLFIFLFFIGFVRLLHVILTKAQKEAFLDIGFFMLLAFFTPYVLIIILNSTLYNGWRHLYFTYPFFIIISTYSYGVFSSCISKVKHFRIYRLSWKLISNVVIFVYFISLIWQIYKYHPFQSVYFNIAFASKANNLFEIDYYGLSYMAGLNYICNEELNDIVTVYGPSIATELNILFLPIKNRKKLLYRKPWKSKYILTTGLIQISDIHEYRYMVSLKQTNPIKTIKIGNIILLQIYKQ